MGRLLNGSQPPPATTVRACDFAILKGRGGPGFSAQTPRCRAVNDPSGRRLCRQPPCRADLIRSRVLLRGHARRLRFSRSREQSAPGSLSKAASKRMIGHNRQFIKDFPQYFFHELFDGVLDESTGTRKAIGVIGAETVSLPYKGCQRKRRATRSRVRSSLCRLRCARICSRAAETRRREAAAKLSGKACSQRHQR